MKRLLAASLAAVGLAWCADAATAQEKTSKGSDNSVPALLIPPAPPVPERTDPPKEPNFVPAGVSSPASKTPEKIEPAKDKVPATLIPPATVLKIEEKTAVKGPGIVPASVAARPANPIGDLFGFDGGHEGWHGAFFADVGIGIVRPFWKQNPAFYAGNFSASDFSTQQQDFLFDGQFTPSMRLGWVSADGLGFRVGWWGFAHSDSAESPRDNSGDEFFTSASPLGLSITTFGSSSDPHVLTVHGRVQVSVWDFEVLHKFGWEDWTVELSGGLRYVYLKHEYRARVIEDGSAVSSLWSRASTNAGGPTLAIDTLRRIGQTNFGVYGTARGSVLFASGRQNATLEFDDSDFTQRASRVSQEVLPIGEVEVGLAWQCCLAGRTHLLLRGGVNGQIWGNAGNTSRSDNINSSSTYDSNMGLLGFNVRVGVEF